MLHIAFSCKLRALFPTSKGCFLPNWKGFIVYYVEHGQSATTPNLDLEN